MPNCSANGCTHRSQRNKTCRFFCFPKDKKEYKRWIRFARGRHSKPVKFPVLCSCHFKDGKKENGPEKKPETEAGGSVQWTDREMLDLAIALQRHGFADKKKIAETVKTKSEADVKKLIHREVSKQRRQMFGNAGWSSMRNTHNSVHKEGDAEGWTDLRKWQKIVQNQQARKTRRIDYSCMIIPEVWERFRSEAEPPSDPQQLNVQAIYGFISQCLRGLVPPELPPKESAALLMLMRLVEGMMSELDVKEEMDFIKNFKKPTTFVPVIPYELFTHRSRKDVVPPPPEGAVPISHELDMLRKQHCRVIQSFNPLAVPLSLMDKHQKLLHSMFDEWSQL